MSSYPIDLKEDQQSVAMETGQETPISEGEEGHPCRFFRRGGGRRGRCNRQRHQATFFHRFAVLFSFFSAVSLVYTHRQAITHCFQPAIDFASSWLSGPYNVIKNLADIPYQLHPFIGLLFYSALAAFLLTSLKMRRIQKRRARMQLWMAKGGGHRHRHHSRHAHFDQCQAANEQQGLRSQEEMEKAPLIVVDES